MKEVLSPVLVGAAAASHLWLLDLVLGLFGVYAWVALLTAEVLATLIGLYWAAEIFDHLPTCLEAPDEYPR